MAYLLLRNSDQEKYGRLFTLLSFKYSMNDNQYPDNVTYDIYIINNHCDDNYRSQVSKIHNSQNETQNT